MALLRTSSDRLPINVDRGSSASIFWMLAEQPLLVSPTLRVLGLMGQHLGGFE